MIIQLSLLGEKLCVDGDFVSISTKVKRRKLMNLREELQDRMDKLFHDGFSLSSPEMIRVSEELDEVVRELMRLASPTFHPRSEPNTKTIMKMAPMRA